jgi:hypothetical protein
MTLVAYVGCYPTIPGGDGGISVIEVRAGGSGPVVGVSPVHGGHGSRSIVRYACDERKRVDAHS